MKFTLRSLILWPRNKEFRYRQLDFTLQSGVNIITGASKTGKSAIIPIIDYCLGARECAIPVGVIRDTCEWFGTLFDLKEEQLLLCRREPGSRQSTGDMFFARGKKLSIPNELEKNITVEQIKNILNELLSLPFIEIDPTAVDNFGARPSYRELMAFIFQPQNVVANNRVLFYNIEKLEHKKRLVNIFPYVLGAMNAETLAAIQERDRLTKERDKLFRELKEIKNVAERWKQEVLTWLSQSRELGLTSYTPDSNSDFSLQVNELRRIINKSEQESSVTANNITDMSDELLQLRKNEQQLSMELSVARSRHEAMTTLNDSKRRYDESLQIQMDRLNISSWLRSLATNDTCPICGDMHGTHIVALDELCDAMSELERQAGTIQGMSISFDREFNIVKSEIDSLASKLSAIRKRINTESAKAQEKATAKYTLASVARFLGRMEFAIQTYERIGTDGELEERLGILDEKISSLNKILNDDAQKKKEQAALAYIQQAANVIVKELDVERPDDPIEFVIDDLTIKVQDTAGRSNFLWEIGSAANSLGYHIAVSLAFQKFFQERKYIAIPNILVFDQPSQVYFPQKNLRENSTAEEDLQLLDDEDQMAVKKVFAAFSNFIKASKSELQIIVMEHADADIWGGLDNIALVERWRGERKLVPLEWQ